MRSLLILALLAVPGLTLAQERQPPKLPEAAKAADTDKKLADLEAKLQALLKEIQSLRTEKKTSDTVRGRVIEKLVEKQTDKTPEKLPEKKEGTLHLVPSKEGNRLTLTLDKDGKVLRQWMEKPDPNAKPGERKSVLIVEDGVTKELVLDAATGKIISQTVTQQHKPAVTSPTPPTHSYTVASRADNNTIHLTRVTYSLSAAQAKALDAFLKDNVKASVLETKVEGDKIVVTTTPDVQGTIGQLIHLMSGKSASASHTLHLNIERALAPTAPPAPAEPAKPVKPPRPKQPEVEKPVSDTFQAVELLQGAIIDGETQKPRSK